MGFIHKAFKEGKQINEFKYDKDLDRIAKEMVKRLISATDHKFDYGIEFNEIIVFCDDPISVDMNISRDPEGNYALYIDDMVTFSDKDFNNVVDAVEKKFEELGESFQRRLSKRIMENILNGKDIRKALLREASPDDFAAQGKELADYFSKEVGVRFEYDFEFGEIVCFCIDNIPAEVAIIKRPDEKYDLYIGDDVVATKDSKEEISKIAKNRVDNLEVEE